MRPINIIHLRVFSNPEEDREEIKKALLSLLGYSHSDLDKEKIHIKETSAKGFKERTIIILESSLEKERHCNRFIKHLNENLTAENKALLVSQENRLDDNLNFYFRLDKNRLLDGKYVLTDSGNCFHIAMNINAHPGKKEVAYRIIKEIFENEQ